MQYLQCSALQKSYSKGQSKKKKGKIHHSEMLYNRQAKLKEEYLFCLIIMSQGWIRTENICITGYSTFSIPRQQGKNFLW